MLKATWPNKSYDDVGLDRFLHGYLCANVDDESDKITLQDPDNEDIVNQRFDNQGDVDSPSDTYRRILSSERFWDDKLYGKHFAFAARHA